MPILMSGPQGPSDVCRKHANRGRSRCALIAEPGKSALAIESASSRVLGVALLIVTATRFNTSSSNMGPLQDTFPSEQFLKR